MSQKGNASEIIIKAVNIKLKAVQDEVSSRAYRASNELRNASLFILRGTRTGKVYRLPDQHGQKHNKPTKKMLKDYGRKLRSGQLYRASAPDESPAVRFGHFRNSWGADVRVEKTGKRFRAVSYIKSNIKVGNHLLGDILEDGTKRMKPRQYKQKVIDRAMPQIKALYKNIK